jgi:tetratricopeptide (TPR) repeat protein
MKRLALLVVVLLCGTGFLWADFQETIAQADRLHEQDRHEEALQLLQSGLPQAQTPAQRAEVLWRTARACLNLGDQAEDRGAKKEELLSFFEKGEEAARQAVEADPGNHLGYYWQSGNTGRWGQVKGILNSLAKARPMRNLLTKAVQLNPEHADSYYVLGQLYEQVPGAPISFGNKEWAVSLGRKAVDLHERQLAAGREKETLYDFYTELAKHLHARDWDAARRAREQPRSRSRLAAGQGVLEKSCYYEAAVGLKNVSDREEALEIVRQVVQRMEALSSRKPSQEQDLKEARQLLKEWG